MQIDALTKPNRGPKPAIGVAGLIFDAEGRVLLIQRARPPQAGLWHLPGGKLEAGESLAECCRREVLEETGLRIETGPIVAIADRQVEGFHYIVVDFLARLAEGQAPTPHPSSDAADARWMSPNTLSQLPLVEGLAEVIESARSGHHGTARGLARDAACGWLYLPTQAVLWDDGSA